MHKYKILSKKGEGTFSEVFKAMSVKTGRLVAIKRMKQLFRSKEQVNSLREIQALKRLENHPNTIQLLEVLYDRNTGRLALVFELMTCNLYEVIKGRKEYLAESKVKLYMYQMLRALDFLHRNGIFHRDIKPENVLVTDDLAKLADFGSCRGIYTKQPFSEYISTRWYRAPECLLTDGYYNYKMDIWGAGCVLFEILMLYPLFPGSDELDQIHRIHAVMGTPTKELLSKFKQSAHMDFNFQYTPGTGLGRLLKNAPQDLMDLLTHMLSYDPDERFNARQCLRHPYFKELREADRKSQHLQLTSPTSNSTQHPPQTRSRFSINGSNQTIGGSQSNGGQLSNGNKSNFDTNSNNTTHALPPLMLQHTKLAATQNVQNKQSKNVSHSNRSDKGVDESPRGVDSQLPDKDSEDNSNQSQRDRFHDSNKQNKEQKRDQKGESFHLPTIQSIGDMNQQGQQPSSQHDFIQNISGQNLNTTLPVLSDTNSSFHASIEKAIVLPSLALSQKISTNEGSVAGKQQIQIQSQHIQGSDVQQSPKEESDEDLEEGQKEGESQTQQEQQQIHFTNHQQSISSGPNSVTDRERIGIEGSSALPVLLAHPQRKDNIFNDNEEQDQQSKSPSLYQQSSQAYAKQANESNGGRQQEKRKSKSTDKTMKNNQDEKDNDDSK
ncbi:MAG: putative MAPK/MAK/MRK overlapping kinase [Streblomastix strix]|uniref:Putative MAPK/MAK/MRK overlapping kinase n=1 Tax=Streblomastix strix TaxID=222440 RepID=A0A5J4V1H0_9EUKA|nr:MAG: putative MAPK/MAK/MRK overlapping kinase [Streblomastix strix]